MAYMHSTAAARERHAFEAGERTDTYWRLRDTLQRAYRDLAEVAKDTHHDHVGNAMDHIADAIGELARAVDAER